MVDIKTNSSRADIMDMMRNNFGKLSLWQRIEVKVALICSKIPEPVNKETKIEFIEKLKELKLFISQYDVPEEDLNFFDEEIRLHNQTKMVSLYEEEEDYLDPNIIKGYCRLGKGSEGVVAIKQRYNYQQLSNLTNEVYKKTKLVKFYISQEQTIYGKIVAEIYEFSQEIPIATLVESKRVDRELGYPKNKTIKLFGQKFSRSEFNAIKEINIPFYVYRFITNEGKEFILLTLDQCTIGDYGVTGVRTQCEDYKILTDTTKLPTKLPFFFAQSVKNRIVKFKNHDQFLKKLKELDINKENLFDYPFSILKNKKFITLLHPNWYKWLIWSWLTHQKKGMINNYPLHLMVIGQPGAGKSTLINGLYTKSKETRDVFSGAGSTLKSLVPSFKYQPAKLGYLSESNRFSFCDEFLRCLINTRSTKESSLREESVAIMNDLLEHQKREVGSGVSKVKVNMTSRVLAVTNAINGINNVGDLVQKFDPSFLSRWIIYYQTEDHAQLIKKNVDEDLKIYDFKIPINDWISILDYLNSFSSEYNSKKIEEIYKSVPKILSEDLNKHYDTRHRHHIECIIDGIIKTRCLLEKDMSFRGKKEDYTLLKEIWLKIVGSWIDFNHVMKAKIEDRIFYLPENTQYLYWRIFNNKTSINREQVKKIALRKMSLNEYYEAFNILTSLELLKEEDGLVKSYYFDKLKEEGE